MKKIVRTALSIPLALVLTTGMAIAEEDDSLLEKSVKLKVYQEADDDSTLKKAAGLKATSEVLGDEEDSGLKKAAKLKMLEEASD